MKYILCLLLFAWCAPITKIPKMTEVKMSNANLETKKSSQCTSPANCSLVQWSWLSNMQKNINNTDLEICSTDPVTWYQRDGYCKTWPQDPAQHSVCGIVTTEFLQYTKSKGNDLMTPQASFPWLKPWDRRCLCAARRREAYDAWVIVSVVSWATNLDALSTVAWW